MPTFFSPERDRFKPNKKHFNVFIREIKVFINNFTLYENAEYDFEVSFEKYKQTNTVGNYIECLHEIQSYAVLVRICFLKPYYNEYKFLGENVGA